MGRSTVEAKQVTMIYGTGESRKRTAPACALPLKTRGQNKGQPIDDKTDVEKAYFAHTGQSRKALSGRSMRSTSLGRRRRRRAMPRKSQRSHPGNQRRSRSLIDGHLHPHIRRRPDLRPGGQDRGNPRAGRASSSKRSSACRVCSPSSAAAAAGRSTSRACCTTSIYRR